MWIKSASNGWNGTDAQIGSLIFTVFSMEHVGAGAGHGDDDDHDDDDDKDRRWDTIHGGTLCMRVPAGTLVVDPVGFGRLAAFILGMMF